MTVTETQAKTANSAEGLEQPPTPASTVAIMREPEAGQVETLLLKRNSRLVFHGGHWVFPGGRIDPVDYPGPVTTAGLFSAAVAAAVRETAEEAGIQIRPDDLIHTAHWTTPPNLPRRFSTWFFVCVLTDGVEVRVDDDEIKEHRWLTPETALAMAKDKEIVLPRPTESTLRDLCGFSSLNALSEAMQRKPVRVFPDPSPFYRPEEMGLGQSH